MPQTCAHRFFFNCSGLEPAQWYVLTSLQIIEWAASIYNHTQPNEKLEGREGDGITKKLGGKGERKWEIV